MLFLSSTLIRYNAYAISYYYKDSIGFAPINNQLKKIAFKFPKFIARDHFSEYTVVNNNVIRLF